ncbi:hypothetical protein THER_0443 [Thermodesulfovibrio sp. N1]|nr:hypothetical protein THER_0443 [Thermodesulfovibrio sp. N1]
MIEKRLPFAHGSFQHLKLPLNIQTSESPFEDFNFKGNIKYHPIGEIKK